MAKSEQHEEISEPTRAQRILTAMIVGVIGTAIVSIIVLIASAAFGWKGLFPIFGPLASIGMLAGMVLMVVLLIVSVRAKVRQNRENQ
jgi:cation transporter-like permease